MEDNFLLNRFLPLATGVYFEDLLGNSITPPPGESVRITDDTIDRITDTGLVRITD